MINSQNVLFEAQFASIFILWKSHVSFMRYSSFNILNHFINFKNCDVLMSISFQGRVRFWVYLLNRESFGHETRPVRTCLELEKSVRLTFDTLEENKKGLCGLCNILKLYHNSLYQSLSYQYLSLKYTWWIICYNVIKIMKKASVGQIQ